MHIGLRIFFGFPDRRPRADHAARVRAGGEAGCARGDGGHARRYRAGARDAGRRRRRTATLPTARSHGNCRTCTNARSARTYGACRRTRSATVSTSRTRTASCATTRPAARSGRTIRAGTTYRTLRGEYGARSTRSDPNDDSSTVMHVAAPIRHGNEIIGVLTIAKPNQTVAPFIARSQRKIMLYGALLMGGAILIGVACTWWLVVGLRRLRAMRARSRRASAPTCRCRARASWPARARGGKHASAAGRPAVRRDLYPHAHARDEEPLAAISGAAELLQEDMPVANRRRFTENIRRQAGRLEQMIRKLLALAEVEQKQRLSVREPVALRPVLEQLVDDIEPRAARREPRDRRARRGRSGSRRRRSVPAAPGARQPARQRAGFRAAGQHDPHRARTAAGGQGARRGRACADDGPGVPDYALARVFERFYSLPRPDGRIAARALGCVSSARSRCCTAAVALANRDEGGACATLTLPSAG